MTDRWFFFLILGGQQTYYGCWLLRIFFGALWPGGPLDHKNEENVVSLAFTQAGLCSYCIFILRVSWYPAAAPPGTQYLPVSQLLSSPTFYILGWKSPSVMLCLLEHVSCWKDNAITFDLDTSRHYHFQGEHLPKINSKRSGVIETVTALFPRRGCFGQQEFPVVLFIFHPCSYRQKESSF